jgi:AraC family transcriptional regulator of adaptative response/methylated-DNA-[protein]-cysteine methyltransferase
MKTASVSATLPHSATVPSYEDAWRAVLARDAGSDGAFVYGVRSTFVYCRPSCPARRPLRKNVSFFANGRDAELLGYRACRRCLPRSSGKSGGAATVDAVCAYVEAHIDESVTLAALGRELGLSPFHVQRTFKKITGISPKAYLDARRAERFRQGLKSGGNVTTALYDAGYHATSRAYEKSRSHLGMTPGAFRHGGRGMHIRFTVTRCPFGFLLVGATDRGICRVALADSREELKRALREEFPNATLKRADEQLAHWVATIVARVEGRDQGATIPLDVRATAFQRRVWVELTKIPYGETRSYAEVARAMGAPKAARAVGRACGSNPVALVVPCHRVIREDGDLGGYRWGLAIKKRLLEQERRRRQSGA